MSISSEISRISGNISDSLSAVALKGVTVPSGSNSDDLAGLISQISGGSTEAISIVDTTDAAGGTIRTITAIDISDTTAIASDVLNSKYFYTAAGQKVQGTAVASSNTVSGTFTGSASEKGGAKSLSISYSGNGYPISVQIYPSAGAYKSGSTAYTTVQKNAMVVYSMAKADAGTTPDWGNDAEKNQGYVLASYKSSDSDGTIVATSTKKDTRVFTTQNPVGTYSVNSVKFYDKNTLKVWIADTDEYGFIPEIEYTYQIVYSN